MFVVHSDHKAFGFRAQKKKQESTRPAVDSAPFVFSYHFWGGTPPALSPLLSYTSHSSIYTHLHTYTPSLDPFRLCTSQSTSNQTPPNQPQIIKSRVHPPLLHQPLPSAVKLGDGRREVGVAVVKVPQDVHLCFVCMFVVFVGWVCWFVFRGRGLESASKHTH